MATFDDALRDVSSQAPVADDGVFFEKKEFPLIPEGTYKVICAKAELRDSKSQFDEPGTKRISTKWQVWEPTYKGDDGKDRHYMVWMKPMKRAFGERSNLRSLFLKLTGIDLKEEMNRSNSPFLTKRPVRIPLSDGKYKEGVNIIFDYTLLENMECDVVIVHELSEDKTKTYTKIEAVACTKETREKNRLQLGDLLKSLVQPSVGMDEGAEPDTPFVAGGVTETKKEEIVPSKEEAKKIFSQMFQENAKKADEARDAGFPMD